MTSSFLTIAFVAVFCCCSLLSVSARGTGSPRCRIVSRADFKTMPNNDGSGEGFTFTASTTSYLPGQSVTFTIDNTAQPRKTSFVGFLAFVERPDATNSSIQQEGTFALLSGTKYPTEAPCSTTQSAITHSSTAAKSLPYTFTWTAPAAGTGPLTARLAIIADFAFKFQFLTIPLTETPPTNCSPYVIPY